MTRDWFQALDGFIGGVALIALFCAGASATMGCGGGASGTPSDAASSDGASSDALILCTEGDGGSGGLADAAPMSDSGATTTVDELGPNAPALKMPSALGRVNVYEVTTPRSLGRVDIYLGAPLGSSRITIAVQEATSRSTPFQKIKDVQLEVGRCEGWASSGAIDIPLEAGRFYAVGFDPNQPVTPFVSTDADSLPIDGAFGRLIGSKTSTSVSIPTLTWDKLTDKEYHRQRLVTAPRLAAGTPDGGTSPDAGF